MVDPSLSNTELNRLDELSYRGLRFTALLEGGADVGGITVMAERIRCLAGIRQCAGLV